MNKKNKMGKSYTDLQNGFIASMLHDLGKLALTVNKEWPENHGDLQPIGKMLDIDFDNILGNDILQIIKTHHGNVSKNRFDISQLSTSQISLIVADRIISSLSRREEDYEFGELNQTVKFNPFYGNPKDWNMHKAHALLKEITDFLEKNLEINTFIEIQDKLLTYPYQHYYPHLSLGVHHRLSAALYLFLYEKFSSVYSYSDLKHFDIFLIEIDPQPLTLFYRLREAVAYSKVAKKIVHYLIENHYEEFIQKIQFSSKYNPFMFYFADGLIFLVSNPIEDTLKEIVNNVDGIDSLNIKILKTTFTISWKSDKPNIYEIFVNPSDTRYQLMKKTIISDRILNFEKNQLDQCEGCGIPIPANPEEKLCEQCRTLQNNYSSEFSIDKITVKKEKIKNNENPMKIAYLFLNIPNLIDHAEEIAEKELIDRFEKELGLDRVIYPTQHGFIEYLQALKEINKFQDSISDTTDKMKKKYGKNSIEILFKTSEKLCIVLSEYLLWKFLNYLNIERSDLKLNSSLQIFITQKKTPFWSLINLASTYSPNNTLYNITRGEIIMFSAKEIGEIRKLASDALKRHIYPHQFNRLSKFALRTTKDELLLEIDKSADKLRGFEGELKKGLEDLSEEKIPYQDAEKRSIFLKYIGDLVKVNRRR